MPLNVHIHTEKDNTFLINLYENLLPQIAITCQKEIPVIPNYDVLVCGVPDKELIEASPNLKQLIIPWAGLPIKTKELMLNYPGISIHNIHHNAIPTSEMAFTLMMAVLKNLIPIENSFRLNNWSLRYAPPTLENLIGKRALIVGYGTIGKLIAGYCKAFKMTVTGINYNGRKSSDDDAEIFPISELNSLLPNTSILFLSLPLTDNTKSLFKKEQLQLLPDGSTIINISRGAIIDEQALFEQLKTGRLNAGLDVWYNYPQNADEYKNTPPSEFPFNELQNVVMTPHLAGHSVQTEELRAKEIAKLLNCRISGEPIPNQIDLNRGY